MKKNLVHYFLRVEGLAVFLTALVMYFWVLDGSWILFAILILTPDLSFFAYYLGKTYGASLYNSFHTYLGPFVLAGIFYFIGVNTEFDAVAGYLIALIWIAHIGADRAAGYGLKYNDSFKHTHLQRVYEPTSKHVKK